MHPHSKRRRLANEVQFPTTLHGGPFGLSSPQNANTVNNDWSSKPQQGHALAYTPSDSTDGPTFASPLGNTSWGHDGFSHDPGFLASQEELRCMLFTIAQSAVPTRAPSPDEHEQDTEAPQGGEQMHTRPVISNARRVQYLKNYVGQVAPWVSVLRGL